MGWRPAIKRLGSGIKVSLVPLVAVYFLYFSATQIGPPWSAMLGHGTRGTFTAERCERVKHGCSWMGTFVPDDGWPVYTDIGLSNGEGVTHAGQRVRALDVDDQVVYPKDNFAGLSSNVFFLAIFFVVSLATLLIWTLVMVNRVLRRCRRTPTSDWRSGSFS